MRKIFEKYNPASHPFGEVKVNVPVSEEKIVKIVTFEDLDEPIFVNGLQLGYIQGGLPTLKIVHLNKDGQAVVLLNLDARSGASNFGLNFRSLDLGLFKVASGDKLVIEMVSSVSFDLSFLLGLTDTLPVYRCYEFKKVSVSEPVRLLRGSFDTLSAIGVRGVVVNGRGFTFAYGGEQRNGMSVILGKSYYPYHLDISVKDEELFQPGTFGLLVLMKEKYNRDIFQTRIFQLEAVKEEFLFNCQNDFDNEEIKVFLGKYKGIEQVPQLLDQMYQASLNSKYKGVYDAYEVPAIDEVSVEVPEGD